jgi:hypothetical protein
MTFERSLSHVLAISLFGLSLADAAELPSQTKKAKPPEPVKQCNIAGFPGVLAANGICVRMSGYISAGVGAWQVK